MGAPIIMIELHCKFGGQTPSASIFLAIFLHLQVGFWGVKMSFGEVGWGLRGLSGMDEAFHTYLLTLPSRSVRIASRRSQERPAKTRDIVSGLKFARQVYILAR